MTRQNRATMGWGMMGMFPNAMLCAAVSLEVAKSNWTALGRAERVTTELR